MKIKAAGYHHTKTTKQTMKNQRGTTLLELILAVLILLGVIGYILNIYKLASVLLTPGILEWTGLLVLRLLGLIPIVGAFVGWM